MFWTGLAPLGSVLRRALADKWCKWGFAIAVASGTVVGGMVPDSAFAKESSVKPAAAVSLSELPAQAQATHRLILAGGPFPYSKDGIVFGNRERQLPRKARGYYREYTVKTPGSKDRGARRIVCGGEPPPKPEVCFYTDDHYATFRRIAP